MAKKVTRNKSPLERKGTNRKQRRVIFVCCEGSSEDDYLGMSALVSNRTCGMHNEKRRHVGQTDPTKVLSRMEACLAKNRPLQARDEAWIVIDKDDWTDDQVKEVTDWVKASEQHHLAMSNPKFELYLLMHYEDGTGCTNASTVDARLKRRWPEFDKRILSGTFSIDDVKVATDHARRLDRGNPDEVPPEGVTTFYKLVESLLKEDPSAASTS
jgi:hypothetical protein